MTLEEKNKALELEIQHLKYDIEQYKKLCRLADVPEILVEDPWFMETIPHVDDTEEDIQKEENQLKQELSKDRKYQIVEVVGAGTILETEKVLNFEELTLEEAIRQQSILKNYNTSTVISYKIKLIK